jgi:peptidoglycan LD-endopeptidase LytH
MRVRQLLMIAAVLLPLVAGATAIGPLHWPVPSQGFVSGEPEATWVQPTATGEPLSALFGCVRNNGTRFHEGLDLAPVLARRRGEPTDRVLAIAAGVVTHISAQAGDSSYGRYVVIEHDGLNPAVYSLYAHLASVEPTLRRGARVAAGQSLGVMGRSAAGYHIPQDRAHLHLEIGLRLSDNFQPWYDAKLASRQFSTPNRHANFNGANLVGWDPLATYRFFQQRAGASLLDYLRTIDTGAIVHVRTARIPDFVRRYPALLDGRLPRAVAGWEVHLSGWGLPLRWRPLTEAEAQRVGAVDGSVRIDAINPAELERYACRQLVQYVRGGATVPGDSMRLVLELLFGLQPRPVP